MPKNLEEVLEAGMREKIREIYDVTSNENWAEVKTALSYITGLNERQIASIAAWSASELDKKRITDSGKEVSLTVYEYFLDQEMPENVKNIYSKTQNDNWPAMRKALARIYNVKENAISAIARWYSINKRRAQLTDGVKQEIRDVYNTISKDLWPPVRAHYAERYSLTHHQVGGIAASRKR